MKPRGDQHQRENKSSPRSGLVQPAPAANPAMSILFHVGRDRRGVAEVQR
jgi:hypothetical protein